MTNSRRSRKALHLLDVDKNLARVLMTVDAENSGIPELGLNGQAELPGLFPDRDHEFGLSDGERERLPLIGRRRNKRLRVLPAGNARIKPEVQSEGRPEVASQRQFRVGADCCWLLDATHGYVHVGNRNPEGTGGAVRILFGRTAGDLLERRPDAFVLRADRHADGLARQAGPFFEIGLHVHGISLRACGQVRRASCALR